MLSCSGFSIQLAYCGNCRIFRVYCADVEVLKITLTFSQIPYHVVLACVSGDAMMLCAFLFCKYFDPMATNDGV